MLRRLAAGGFLWWLMALWEVHSVSAGPWSYVVFSEILPQPSSLLEFPLGQWFELHNGSDTTVNLAGCSIEIGEEGLGFSYLIETSFPLEPDAYMVIGVSNAWALNGGIDVSLALGLVMTLPKTKGFLRLLCEDQLVDELIYGPEQGLAAIEGASLSLEPSAMLPDLNDDVSRWCLSTSLIQGAWVEVYGTPGGPSASCDSDGDGLSEDQGDCNDFDSYVLPGLPERCNGVDEDCDGLTDEEPLVDLPALSSIGACANSLPVCLGVSGYGWAEAESYEEVEVSCDYVDNDCDGLTDEELRNACGLCGDALEEECNGLDDDCDGTTDEEVVPPPEFTCPGQGSGVCLNLIPLCVTTWTCLFPLGYQKDESWCDNLDNDCDGLTDEGFFIGASCVVGLGGCKAVGFLVCSADPTKTDCQASNISGSMELCGDDIDNDCDGFTDEGFSLGEVCFAGTGSCRSAGKYFCSTDGFMAVCSAEPILPSEEFCDNELDDDCDGLVDELPCSASVNSTLPGCSSASARNSMASPKSAFPFSILVGLTLGLLWILGRWALHGSVARRKRFGSFNPDLEVG